MAQANQAALLVWHAVGAPEHFPFAEGSTSVVLVDLPK